MPLMVDERFARQVRFAAFGAAGQEKLASATAAVVGLGGLGSWIAEQLTRAGVGTLRLIDRDVVEESNLPRQTLYLAEDAKLGRPKAEAAAERLSGVGGPTKLEPHARELNRRSVGTLLGGSTIVLDGLDHFAGRFLLNDWCRKERVPWVYGGAVGGAGSVLLVAPDEGACLRCLFPDAEGAVGGETCDTVGVLSPLPALVGSLQTSEALRWLSGDRRPARLWHVEPWEGRAVALKPGPSSPACPVCARSGFPALEGRDPDEAVKLCGRDTVQVEAPPTRRAAALDLGEFAQRWRGLGDVERSRFLVRLRTGGLVLSLFDDGRALVQGTESLERARALYERLVGR
jgi:adenylyltransferase/sulfurtransferase